MAAYGGDTIGTSFLLVGGSIPIERRLVQGFEEEVLYPGEARLPGVWCVGTFIVHQALEEDLSDAKV
jgi:hypothetical protein